MRRLALRGPLPEDLRRRLPVSGARTFVWCSEPSVMLAPTGCGFPREPHRAGEISSCLVFQREGSSKAQRARAWLRAELPTGRVDLALPMSGLAAGRLRNAYRPVAEIEIGYQQGHLDGAAVIAERYERPGCRDPQWVLEVSPPDGEPLPAWAAELLNAGAAVDVTAAAPWAHRAIADAKGPPTVPRR